MKDRALKCPLGMVPAMTGPDPSRPDLSGTDPSGTVTSRSGIGRPGFPRPAMPWRGARRPRSDAPAASNAPHRGAIAPEWWR